MTPVRKIWIITCLSASLLMSDVSLGAEESLTYDVDGDGVQSSFTDGILIIRYLFGFSGNALISGVVDDGATRATAESIEAYIAWAGCSARLGWRWSRLYHLQMVCCLFGLWQAHATQLGLSVLPQLEQLVRIFCRLLI